MTQSVIVVPIHGPKIAFYPKACYFDLSTGVLESLIGWQLVISDVLDRVIKLDGFKEIVYTLAPDDWPKFITVEPNSELEKLATDDSVFVYDFLRLLARSAEFFQPDQENYPWSVESVELHVQRGQMILQVNFEDQGELKLLLTDPILLTDLVNWRRLLAQPEPTL